MDLEFLTVAQVTELLHISRMTLYRHMRAGDLPYIKIGRRVLFKKADIEAWLESKKII